MEKNYKLPAIAWLRVADFMHGWLQSELGGAARVREQRIVCVMHLPGARELMKMETTEDFMKKQKIGNAMSDTKKNCIEAGLGYDADAITDMYGLTKDDLRQFVPIECPAMCMTKNGVLRPWTLDVCFGREQASALQQLLRDAFWAAVGSFSDDYAREHAGERYAQVKMIEAFCRHTGTPDLYVESMRREWQRRQKRQNG